MLVLLAVLIEQRKFRRNILSTEYAIRVFSQGLPHSFIHFKFVIQGKISEN